MAEVSPAWRRDNAIDSGATVDVVLGPEGPRSETIASDVAAALDREPKAKTFFESLAPFYRTHGRTYSVYFDVLTAPEFEARVAARAAEAAREERLERATVAFVQPGRTADEQAFNYRSDPPTRPVAHSNDRIGRRRTASSSLGCTDRTATASRPLHAGRGRGTSPSASSPMGRVRSRGARYRSRASCRP